MRLWLKLRAELVVLSSMEEVSNWESVGTAIGPFLNFQYNPRMLVLTKKRALVEVETLGDRDKVLNLHTFTSSSSVTASSKWMPGCDTLSSEYFRLKTR